MAQGANVHSLSRTTEALFHQYLGPQANKTTFAGIHLEQLNQVEDFFKININVYSLKELFVNEDGVVVDNDSENDDHNYGIKRQVVATVVRRSLEKYEKTMNVNLFESHFSYVHNFELYAHCFSCSKCDKLFKSGKAARRHESTCEAVVKRKYVGGIYHLHPTVFQELEEEGLSIKEELKYYRFFATFDFEAYLKKTDLPANTEKQTWVAEHIPLSASICSNVPGFQEPVCFVTSGDSKDLVERMLLYLKEISQAAFSTLLLEYEDIFAELAEKIERSKALEPSDGKEKQHPLELLKLKLETWLKELPTFSFNGGRYDINMIKKYLIQNLLEHDNVKMTIKKNNNFMSLGTECLNFLDIANYLAPGFSYDKFLKAYKCSVTKGFLPYEWIDDLEKLNHPHLPPHETFYSSLKKQNISDEDYEWCQKIWNEQEMTSFKDYLIWYNNRDVQPFIEAVEKLSRFYKENSIDLFKDGISVPGLTMKYLFMNLPHDTYFTLFDEKNSDLHDLVKSNVVGGPSIIFHRHHEVGETKIRQEEFGEEAKVCGGVLGFDANALYLHCLMQDMPTGWFVRRKAPDFKAVASHRYGRLALEWLEFTSAKEGIEIRHQFNGKEKRVGMRRLPVDGWCKETQTIYQFHGCFWHGHSCHLNKNKIVNEVRGKPMRELYEETHKNSEYIKKLGYDLIEIWECEWLALKAGGAVKNFVDQYFPRKVNPWKRLTETQVLSAISDGSIFGMVECDINVPQHLRQHFAEMQPIFKNTTVSRQDLGNHMQLYAEENGYLQQPSRMLVGSYFGEKILLATPLLKWYLTHGLVVSRIYQVVEYEPKCCFKSFGDSVSSARRDGDADPDQSIVAETMKLLGNSGYGKTVTNKDKHRNVQYTNNDKNASDLINTNFFRSLNQLSENLYEIDMNKKMIKYDLPLHIGFFVYNYAKLRMLEFYYDFLDKYVDRKDFQYVEMDTDSAYLALSAPNLEAVIKKERRQDFYENWDKWLPAEACSQHRSDFVEKKVAGEVWEARACCKARKAFDKRTPGLFKVEWEGEGIIGLCSKTYYCYGNVDKCSSKGLSKRQNNLKKERYLKVLNERKAGRGINEGFQVKHNKIFTYKQERAGLSYFYSKRIVLDDGVSTLPTNV